MTLEVAGSNPVTGISLSAIFPQKFVLYRNLFPIIIIFCSLFSKQLDCSVLNDLTS